MTFEPENDFERRLRAAAANPAARPAFDDALLRETVYLVLFPDEDAKKRLEALPPGESQLAEGAHLTLRTITWEGCETIPIFSAPSRVWAFTRETHMVAPSDVASLFREHPGKGFFLNPGSDFGKHFTPKEVEARLEGRTAGQEPGRLEAGTRVLIGAPSADTSALRQALLPHLERMPTVESAWLPMVAFGENPPELLLEVLVSDESAFDPRPLGALLGSLASPTATIALMVSSRPDEILSRRTLAPFYVKKSKSFLGRLFGR